MLFRSLYLGSAGFVTCFAAACPRPDAVADLLGDRETDHVVQFRRDGFDIRHPLRERLDGDLFVCTLHNYLRSVDLNGLPDVPGRYRASSLGTGGPGGFAWEFELIEENEETDHG